PRLGQINPPSQSSRLTTHASKLTTWSATTADPLQTSPGSPATAHELVETNDDLRELPPDSCSILIAHTRFGPVTDQTARSTRKSLFLAAALQTRVVPPFLRAVRTFLFIMFAVSVRAADPDSLSDWLERMRPIVPRDYVCPRATGSVTIDGKLDDAAWAVAPWTEEFVDIEGDAKPKPRFRTRAKMLWDDENFYVAAEMEEPHVWGTLTKHDAVIFNDNDFEVFIDPDGDSHEYYEFEMNALNTGWDLLLKKPYKDGGPALNEWEIPGLKTAVHLDGTLNNPSDRDRGWTLEIAFPWPALRALARRPAPPREGDQWRVSFSRVEWLVDIVEGKYRKVAGKKEDNWVWAPEGIVELQS